ncbi:IBR domain protein [Rhizoctonia solani]|uniref:RBR-type E3 ubiquitin transferase n=1 Tax=Rhizoctonia solani TaxID=456999 RepID=A0A8H8P6Q0_9AGAM|nr:IBR domain protein [Rhizoctonia solani]QRW24803.1 IBR domain protein [Rhizoctonia solani]
MSETTGAPPRGTGRGRPRGRSRGGRYNGPARPMRRDGPPARSETLTEPPTDSPDVTPAPKTTEGPTPVPSTNPPVERSGRGRGSRNFRRGGRSEPRPRPDKQPARDAHTTPTPREPSMEPDSSSSYSSSVQTPTHPHSTLAPDEPSPSHSQPGEPRNKGKAPEIQEPHVSLDHWAESAPDEEMWKPDDSWESSISTTSIILGSPAFSKATPSKALSSGGATPSNEPAGPAHPIQPPIEDSPTFMRRVGLAYVLLGPGASVQAVFTDAESPWVMLSNLPRHIRKHNLYNLLAAFGPTRSVRIYEPRRETRYLASARILFERHEQARYAVDHLQGQMLLGRPIVARLDTDASGGFRSKHIPGINDDSAAPPAKPESSLIANDPTAIIKSATVKVTWFAPTSTVYVTYATAKYAMEKVKEMNGRTFMNRRVNMTPMFPEKESNSENAREQAREAGGYMVRITGLMGDPEMDKLRRFVRSNDVVVHPNYSSEAGLPKLREELADVAPLESFRLMPNRRDDLKFHAMAQYTTPAAAAAAVKVFEGRKGDYLGNSPIWVSRHLTVRYSISSKLAEVLQGEINKLHSWAIDDPDLYVRQTEDQHKPGFIQLLLAGNDTRQLVAAKSQLDQEGASFLESVAKSCKICARADKRTNSILLFGPRYAREEASQQLRAKLVSHSRLRRIVRLQKSVFTRLAKGGITILRDLVGKGSLYVDLLDETLTFYGDDEVVRRVQQALDLMYSETGSKLRRKSDCVVCFCRPEKALLFSCGHHYCKSCFSQYVASAAENRTLPLLCVGDGCKAPIPLSMITLHANQPDQEALFYTAFQAYVTAHPDQYRYCPTPDCQYIYRVGPEDATVQCRLCLSNICTHCHVEQHEGITCADYKASHDDSEIQRSFDRWRATHNVKPCPNCSAPIEKIAGCNHMMCSACRTHMCWVCLAGFAKGDEVYDHMRKKHGGIGL